MMENNIPIYRAKKINSDEDVIGFYSSAYDIHHYIITHLGVDTKANVVYQMSTDIHKIDPTTLSIHFPDMLDSQGNKIFASLSEDGKGGDMFECSIIFRKQENIFNGTFIYRNRMFTTDNYCVNQGFAKKIKVIGIQK